MTQVPSDDERLKDLFKTALLEVLEERKDILRDLIEETLEDIALARAIEQGQRDRLNPGKPPGLFGGWVFLPDHWCAIIFPPYPLTISKLPKIVKARPTV